jgi:tetratricopeptide (TPR) repeat protein
VLDDAASSEQVGPLLPSAEGCLVLVTSRRRLTALDDARAISLDTLPPPEAAALLARLAARPGLDPGDPAVAQITELCGYLPLAVGMLARQLHHHPAWTPADLAADLAAARDRLELMAAEDLSVAAAFDLSYQDLTPQPAADVPPPGPASRAGHRRVRGGRRGRQRPGRARRTLEALYGLYLIAEPARGRYRFHDLIREHARALAATDPQEDQDAATTRLLDYYQHTAALAEARLARQTRPGPAPAAVVAVPAIAPDLSDSARALAWLRAERAGLLACLDHAASTGQHARVAALTAALAGLFRRDGPWADAVTRYTTAIQATRCLGDRLGEASALVNLGTVQRMMGDYPGAARALPQALDNFRDLGDPGGEAETLNERGALHRVGGDLERAEGCHQQALELAREIGSSSDEAHALAGLARCALAAGRTAGAQAGLRQAREIFQRIGAAEDADVSAELDTLTETGPAAER